MEFSQHIKTSRVSKNLSKSELARRVGITPQYVTDIENGRIVPSEEIIQKLVNSLEVDEFITFKLADKVPLRVLEEAKREYYASHS